MKNEILTTLHVLKAWFAARLPEDPERGSVTIEVVLWAAAIIVLIGLVIAAITAFVNAQIAKIA